MATNTHKNQRIRIGLLGLGLFILGLGTPGLAQEVPSYLAQNNQSDVGGTNVGDLTNPSVDGLGDPVLDEETINMARQFSDELERAYADCVASQEAIAQVPRRFARGPAPDVACVSVACEQLNQLMAEVRTFLSTLNSEQVEQLQRNPALRLW